MKYLITFIVAIVLVVALGSAYVYGVNKINQHIVSIEETALSAETLTQRDARLRGMEKFLSETTVERTQLERFIVRDESVVSVIELIEVLANNERVDLSISGVTILDQEGWNSHEAVELAFSASGTFGNLQTFIASLESLPLASYLSDVSLEAGVGSSWFGTFRVVFLKEKI